MYTWNLENERLEAESYLTRCRTDFTATYMKVANLQFIIAQQPEIVQAGTVSALCRVLEGNEHNRQRQAFFLFKKAADAMADIIRFSTSKNLTDLVRQAFTQILSNRNGPPLRAAAEAMGALPLDNKAPAADFTGRIEPNRRRVEDIREIFGQVSPAAMRWMGRSLVVSPPAMGGRRFVLKFARPGQSSSDLAAETRWMQFLAALPLPDAYRFDIPEPLAQPEPVVYRLSPSALAIPDSLDIDTSRRAIGYTVPKGYFSYPNHPVNGKMLDADACRRILCRNAKYLGRLAAMGIIHTAPIPLFHNRIQRHRREDHGLYEWRRGGRLDQWLASCRFPNIGASGIRDFEHFVAFSGPPRRLYELIGAHAFSLILIAGSYFRNHDETRVGIDADGNPVDARPLFDQKWLARVLSEVFDDYYQGFTGFCYAAPYPFDPETLSRRLVEEMGVDHHMEEVLRIAEQNSMSRAEFYEFLAKRGFTKEQAAAVNKGEQDITLLTGPHLGGFNHRISVPELTEYTAALAALCIMDGYLKAKNTT